MAGGNPLLPITREVADGDSALSDGGATFSAVSSRANAGEPLGPIAVDSGTPADQFGEAHRAIWLMQTAG